MSGKPRHLTKNGRVRGPAFTPTDAQRRLVAQLIGLHVTWAEIQQLVIHPKTGEPISRKTLAKYFRRELAAGGAMLKQLAASKYFQALEAGESWAVRMAMRNRFGWVVEGSAPVPAEVLSAPVDEPTLRVCFVLPTPKESEPPPIIDAVPQEPADYSKPALPPPSGQEIDTPFGTWRTVVDRGDSKGWMR